MNRDRDRLLVQEDGDPFAPRCVHRCSKSRTAWAIRWPGFISDGFIDSLRGRSWRFASIGCRWIIESACCRGKRSRTGPCLSVMWSVFFSTGRRAPVYLPGFRRQLHHSARNTLPLPLLRLHPTARFPPLPLPVPGSLRGRPVPDVRSREPTPCGPSTRRTGGSTILLRIVPVEPSPPSRTAIVEIDRLLRVHRTQVMQ